VLGRLLLFFSHRDFVCGELLLLLSKLINVVGWIGTSRKQIEHWLVRESLFPNFIDLICDWLSEVVTKSLLNVLVAGKHSSVLSHGSDETHVEEVTKSLVIGDCIMQARDFGVFRFVLVEELLPFLLEAADLIWQILKEEHVVIAELVLREGNNIEPHFLVHPVVFLVAVINTSTSL
jgi:hypothetical protein